MAQVSETVYISTYRLSVIKLQEYFQTLFIDVTLKVETQGNDYFVVTIPRALTEGEIKHIDKKLRVRRRTQ